MVCPIHYHLDLVADSITHLNYSPDPKDLKTLAANDAARIKCVALYDANAPLLAEGEYQSRIGKVAELMAAGKTSGLAPVTRATVADEFEAKRDMAIKAGEILSEPCVKIVQAIYTTVAKLLNDNAEALADAHGGKLLALATGNAVGGLARIYRGQSGHIALRGAKLRPSAFFNYRAALSAIGIEV